MLKRRPLKSYSRNTYANRNFAPKGGFNKSTNKGINWKLRIWTLVVVFFIIGGVGFTRFYVNIIKELPDISEIEDFSFKQTTSITDRNGEQLFKLFDENRRYIAYEQISEHFINGLVATEDQRFWENPGVDRKGTLRAGITDITQGKTHGGSTLTQQIIKNILLTPEKKIERKLKEMLLALRLGGHVRDEIEKNYNNLSSDQLDLKTKEKILEIYANLVFFGNNAYGVEAASMTYFNKNAIDLSILESAVLAGLPQSPSRYNIYSNRGIVMGSLEITDTQGTPAELSETLKSAILERISGSIDESRFTFKRDDTAALEFMRGLLSFKITHEGQTYQVNYSQGRKDIVLARMYEEGYITEAEFKNAFFDGFTYEFSHGKIEIKAPHFVFWVRELLEENYDAEILQREGLTIVTSLDYAIQKMAEDAINENEQHLLAYSAGNSSMIYIDSKSGDVLAYVGSKDYNNQAINGQVDIVRANRQPGSSIKPFVYALGLMKLPLTIDSPIYDIPMSIANNTPQNADGGFDGLVPLKRALAASRNIPAIKMFLAGGGENPFKQFLYDLGVRSLVMNQQLYGYPLSIGAGEMTMLELAQAYTHLSAMGTPATINPILEIRAADGSILYKKQTELHDQVIPTGVAYLIWDILSDKGNLPTSWINNFSYPGINFAMKSGTTNVVRGEDKLPRDGWLAAYTPDKVMVHWAGNSDGTAMRRDAFGGWLNSPIWKSFVRKLEQSGNIQNIQPTQADVRSVAISTISGKLASAETPLAFTKQSLGFINSLPTQVDNNIASIEIDNLCGLLPTEFTPESDRETALVISPESILPDRRDQSDIIQRWTDTGLERFSEQLGTKLLLETVEGTCEEREILAEMGEITIEIMQPSGGQSVTREFTLWHQSKSPFVITSLKLFLGNIELRTIDYNKQGTVTDIATIRIPEEIPAGTYPLRATISDDKGYSDTQTVQIRLISEDTNPPVILEDRIRVTESGDNYEVTVLFRDDESRVSSGTIFRGEGVVHSFSNEVVIFTIDNLEPVTYSVEDASGNLATGEIVLENYR